MNTETGTAVATVERRSEVASQPKHEDQLKFDAVARQADALSRSTVIPEDYRGSAANCLVALEMANRTGVPTLAVMQNLHLIKGRPSWSSTFLIAAVNGCGRFSPIRYRFQGTEGQDDWGCRAVAVDRESGEELAGTLITIQMAKDEGWFNKSGSKWKTMPEQMLRYRAAAFWARTYAPELAVGLHTKDEVEDMPAPRAHRTQAAAAALDRGEPEVLVGHSIEDPPEPTPEVQALIDLRDKARTGGLLDIEVESAIADALESEDPDAIRRWTEELTHELEG